MHFETISMTVLAAGLLSGTAHAENPLTTLIVEGTPVIDLRARHESVDDKSKARPAMARRLISLA